MSDEKLELLLTRLREEVAILEADGVRASPRLRTLVDDIEQQIKTQEDGVTGELKRRVEVFEVEHPRVTDVVVALPGEIASTP